MKRELRIVCAAYKYGELVVCGVRHGDRLMHNQLRASREDSPFHTVPLDQVVQGFVDSKGNFLDRKEALVVAQGAGQIIKKNPPEDELYSEDIY
ncbi:hypothetical protein [Pectobacterium phage Wc4-1]|uniref:Uncharacterized protein n=1 Tax=Pectobacterium phage Wc4 TaxID=2652428 RepID=A0A5P8D4A3_9CAUD|nr:hypothetical protein [Pectobacterium phage Wc4]QFP93968.1 hypothetical protein [Pectobacterium phage Wc4-1]